MDGDNASHEAKKATILVVDDNDAGRYATARMLRKAGFLVTEAASGSEALEKADSGTDLVVLDVNLPDIDGFEICRKLRESPATAHIPILHLSAHYQDDESKVKGLDSGADAYLIQPVEHRVLLSTISALLRMRRAEKTQAQLAREWQITFDAVNDVIWLLDAGQRIVRTNRASQEIFGLSAEALIGRHCWEIVHTTKEPHPQCPISRMRETLRRERTELPVGDRVFLVTVDPLLDAQGSFAGAVHMVSDITELRLAERSLQESQLTAETIFETGLATVMVDEDGTVLAANPSVLP